MIEQIYHEACLLPSDINEHLPLLRQLGEQCQHITEFGVRGIVSTWAWVAARPRHLHLYDVVHPQDYPYPGVPPYQWSHLLECTRDIHFEFHQEDTRQCTIEPTELLFIDTLHTGPQLQQELIRHHHQVSKLIVLHDTDTFGQRGERPDQPGLDYGLLPWIVNSPWRILFRTPVNNGLTILRKK